MCCSGLIQSVMNADMLNPDIPQIFIEYDLVKKSLNTTVPLGYVIVSPYSAYTWFYLTCVGALINVNYILIIKFTVKTMKHLNTNQNLMSKKTFAMNKQINYILLIQVSISIKKKKYFIKFRL